MNERSTYLTDLQRENRKAQAAIERYQLENAALRGHIGHLRSSMWRAINLPKKVSTQALRDALAKEIPGPGATS